MSLYQDTKKSYYAILANKMLEGNRMFTVQLRKGGCYSGKQAHRTRFTKFETYANREAQKLRSVSGNIIPVDESIFTGFPATPPPTCVPLEATCKTGEDGIKRCDWTRNWYWDNKEKDYKRIKKEIDEKLAILKEEEEKQKQKIAIQVKKQEDVKKLSGIGITAILAYVALKK